LGPSDVDPLDWDYRDTHLHRGADYDAALAGDPFDVFLGTRERALLLEAVHRWFPQGIPRYLDFACGTGRITQVVAPLAVHSYGVDIAETMLAVARTKCPQTTFLLRDLTREAAAIEPVQLITAFRFFGNAQDELRRDALRALHAVLADDGVLILDNHRNPWTLRNGIRRLVGRRSDELVGMRLDLHYGKLRRLLTAAGFRIESIQGIGFWMVRASLVEPHILNSRAARLLEGVSRCSSVGPFSPGYVVVATKRLATMPARPR
jgi:SAM-dependent methyltransferase